MAPAGDARRRRDRARGACRLRLRRLRARDRQAHESAAAPARGSDSRATLRLAGAREEAGQRLVEAGSSLGRVPAPGSTARSASSSLEHVADRVERLVVRAGDDELRERCGARGRPAGSRASQGPRSAMSVRAPCSSAGGRGDGGSKAEPTEREERAQERLRVSVGPSRHQLDRAAPRTLRRRDDRARPKSPAARSRSASRRVRPARCREERDHAAVGVADRGGRRARAARPRAGVLLEVDPLDRRAGREAGPVQDDELIACGQRPLRAPRRRAVGTLP